MKDLMNRVVDNLHYLIIAFAIYQTYMYYEEKNLAITTVLEEEASIDAEINSMKRKIATIKEFEKKKAEYSARVENAAKNIEAVQKQMPPKIEDSEIINEFSREILALNIKDQTITPGVEQTGNYFISKGFSLKAEGTYLQFLIFFEKLENADRIYNIKSLKLTNSNQNQRGRFQVISAEAVIEAYRFNPAVLDEPAEKVTAVK